MITSGLLGRAAALGRALGLVGWLLVNAKGVITSGLLGRAAGLVGWLAAWRPAAVRAVVGRLTLARGGTSLLADRRRCSESGGGCVESWGDCRGHCVDCELDCEVDCEVATSAAISPTSPISPAPLRSPAGIAPAGCGRSPADCGISPAGCGRSPAGGGRVRPQAPSHRHTPHRTQRFPDSRDPRLAWSGLGLGFGFGLGSGLGLGLGFGLGGSGWA